MCQLSLEDCVGLAPAEVLKLRVQFVSDICCGLFACQQMVCINCLWQLNCPPLLSLSVKVRQRPLVQVAERSARELGYVIHRIHKAKTASLALLADLGAATHRDLFTRLLGAIQGAPLPDSLWELATLADHR